MSIKDDFGFDDMGDVIIKKDANYLKLNDDTDMFSHLPDDPLPNISTTFEEQSEDYVEADELVKDALISLESICSEFGVDVTISMENQVKACMRNEVVYHSHLLWYIRGIVMANQSQILPKISESVSTMSMEVKFIQNASNKMNNIAGKLTSVADNLKDSILQSTATIKEDFEKTLLTISANHKLSTPNITPIITKAVTPTPVPAPATAPVDLVSEEFKQNEDVDRTAKETTADRAAIMKLKRAFLLKLGVSKTTITGFGDDIDLLLSDADFSSMKLMKMDKETKLVAIDVLFKEFEVKLSEMEG